MNAPQISPAWQDALERIASRRTSPVLMPGAIQTLLALAEEGLVPDGEVQFADFERAFAKVMDSIGPSKRGQAWRPFFHLSVGVRLWSLKKDGGPASFADLSKGKPTGAASLKARVDSAQIREDLIGDILLPATRALIHTRVREMLPPVEKSVN